MKEFKPTGDVAAVGRLHGIGQENYEQTKFTM